MMLEAEIIKESVVYISRKLLLREQRYSTVEKECLAIKWALEMLKYYLLGWHPTYVEIELKITQTLKNSFHPILNSQSLNIPCTFFNLLS